MNLIIHRNSITFAYFSAGGYPFFDYLEYPFLMVQNLVLLLLLLHYKGSKLTPMSVMLLTAYAVAVFLLANNHVPKTFLQFLNVS